MKSAALILNGELTSNSILSEFIVCADGGYSRLKKIYPNLKPDIVIGDMDSVLDNIQGIKAVKHPSKKNKSDGELCIDYLYENGFEKVNIFGAFGGRKDFEKANLLLLPYALGLGIKARVLDSDVTVEFFDTAVKDVLEFDTLLDKSVSVIPEERVEFLSSVGLKYPLQGVVIERFSSKGMSNEAIKRSIKIKLKSGAGYIYY